MFSPWYVSFNLWVQEILWASFCSMLCSFISLSHFIWLGPISPSLASLLLLLNKSSWDMSRRKIFIGKFHLHSTPHLFRLSSQAPKEKELRKKKEVCLPLPSLLICSLAQMTWGYACRSGHSSPHTSWHRVCRNPPPSPTQPSALFGLPASSQDIDYPP